MELKITAVILGLIALFLTFRATWILNNIFKISEPSQKHILRTKIAALIIAVIAFIMVFRVS